jgi:hypothetical protein
MSSIQFLITVSVTITAGSASAVGDPYIQPMEGKLFKLPNRTAIYRVFQGPDNFIINAEVEKFNENAINSLTTQMNKNLFDNSLQVADKWENMYFFRRVWVNGHTFNLETMQWEGEPFPGASDIKQELYTDGGPLYQGEHMFSMEIPLPGNRGKLVLARFPNPQVRSGITAHVTNPDEWDGLIRREYLSKTAQVKKLGATGTVQFKEARSTQGILKKEIFSTRDNATGAIRKVTREIRVI